MHQDELKWYILELNTSDSFHIYYKRVSSIIPKGCAVLAMSKVKHHDYFASRIDRTVLLTNYIFVLCNLEKHSKAIIKALKAYGIDASIMDGLDGKPLEVQPEEVEQLKVAENSIESEEEEFTPGEHIMCVSGPMKGFTGNISLVTNKYIYCSTRVGKIITNIPFMKSDISKY